MIKIQKKQGLKSWQEGLLRVGSIIAALIASGIIIALLGYNPFEVYGAMVKGSLGKPYNIEATIEKCIPLLIMSLGLSIAFKMKFWNIGAEGQFYMGAFGATIVWWYFPTMPSYVLIPLMMLAAIVCGGIVALIPALLKLKLGTNETLVTLMLNYIAIGFITYLANYSPLHEPRTVSQIYRFTDNAMLPEIGVFSAQVKVHIGWIIALVLVVLVFVMMRYSKFGFEISVLGENPDTARYAGMNVAKTLILAVVLSGGICGLAGMLQATGPEGRLTYTLSAGLGFTAVITAWLAKLSAPVILVASFLFSVLLQGGSSIGTLTGIPSAVAETIQGIILFFVLAGDFFANYKFVYKRKEKK